MSYRSKSKEMSIGDFMRSIPFRPHFRSDNSERKFVIPVDNQTDENNTTNNNDENNKENDKKMTHN